MESTQKFDCWEELSREELASISGGNLVDSATSSPFGTVSGGAGNDGASVGTKGVGGSTNLSATGDGDFEYIGDNDFTDKTLTVTRS